MLKRILIVISILIISTQNIFPQINSTVEKFVEEVANPLHLKFDKKVKQKYTTYGYKKLGIAVFLTINKNGKIIQEMITVDDKEYGMHLLDNGKKASEEFLNKHSVAIAVRKVFTNAVRGYISDGDIDGMSLEGLADDVYFAPLYGEPYNKSVNGLKINSAKLGGNIIIGIELEKEYSK